VLFDHGGTAPVTAARLLSSIAVAALAFGCVDSLSGPGNYKPANVRVVMTLPAETPAVWSPVGETLHVAVRRAGRTEPIIDSTFVIGNSLEATLTVPLAYSVERFVITSEVRYRGTLLFLGFEAAQFRSDIDTTVTLATTYVGPGARAATFELLARDTTLSAQDTASLIRVVRDTSGLVIPNVPARYVAARPALVGVDSGGILTAHAGPSDTARVLAYLPTGLNGALVVSVFDTAVTTIDVSPPSASISAASAQTTFTASTRNAAGEPVPAAVIWSSSAPNVATIDQNGVATGVSDGATTITATRGSVSGAAALTVSIQDTRVASITVTPDTATLTSAGATATFTAEASNAAGVPVGATFTWTSSNTAVATVDENGVATAVANGSATITARSDTITGTATLTVAIPDTKVASITVSPPTATLTVAGATATFTAQAFNAAGGPVTAAFNWTSSNTAVATVNQNGVATAVANGTATITANSDTVTGSSMVTVAIPPPPPDPRTTRTWVGGDPAAPNDWAAAANWNPAGVPVSGDSVIIVATANSPSLSGPVTIARLRILGGILVLNGQSLTVTGDFSTENGVGQFAMISAGDTLRVLGNALFNGGPMFDDTIGFLMSEGALFVAGSFEQRDHPDNPDDNYRGVGIHRTVLNGSAQQLFKAQRELDFGSLEILNPAGIRAELVDQIEINATLRIGVAAAIEFGAVVVEAQDSLQTVAGSRLSARGMEISGPMSVAGAFDVDTVEFRGEGHYIQAGLPYRNVIVSDSAVLAGATNVAGFLVIRDDGVLVLNGQTLNVDSLDVGGQTLRGNLRMENAADVLTVRGSAVFRGDSSVLDAGTLFVARDLRVPRRAFQASGTHRTVLNGSATQQMVLSDRTTFHTWEATNPTGPISITMPGGEEGGGLMIANGKFAIRNPIAVTAIGSMIDVGDSLVVVAGSSLTLLSIRMRGAFRIVGNIAASNFDFAGPNQDVPTHLTYNSINVSGQARLLSSHALTGSLGIGRPGSNLTLNGHRISVAGNFYLGEVGNLDTPGGTLTMTNAADSLVVGGDAVFYGAPSTGFLTAGTLVVSGGFFGGPTGGGGFHPTGTQKTVLNGNVQQRVHFEAPSFTESGFNHLELLNTSGGIRLESPVFVAGTLMTKAPSQLISGTSEHLLSVGGVDISRVTLNRIPLAIGGGAITRFDSVTFSQQSLTLTQLSIANPGTASAITFNRTRFLTTPTTGLYVSATDVASGDGNILTIELPEAIPSNGSSKTTTSGGAVVQWTGGAAPIFTTVAAGLFSSCALSPAGRAYCWGDNDAGQLGDGTTADRHAPVAVAGNLTFAQIAVGEQHTCGVTTAGAAYCWGANAFGQLGDGSTTGSLVPVAVSGGVSFSKIALGNLHSCAVTSGGSAYCWGSNFAGQLGDGSTTDRTAPTLVTGGLSFTSITARASHSCALTGLGAAYCWGSNTRGQNGDGTLVPKSSPTAVSGGLVFSTISTGFEHTCAVTTGNAAYCWGENGFGRLGDGTQTDRTTPTAVSGGLSFEGISAGGNSTCGWTTAGAGYCWGLNSDGQVGDGTNTQRLTPVAVAGGHTFNAIDAGRLHALGWTTAGLSFAWGYNGQGGLGDGTTTSRNSPVLITPP
jgi:alpha-tubulin suppressor-like RCC1 family protein/uncharacterized protein YjdB